MAKTVFHGNSSPSLGVELELGLVDADTMELANASGAVLERIPADMRASFKPELLQSCLEINTGVCQNVSEVEADLTAKLRLAEAVTANLNLRLWWGGTHPFSTADAQLVTPDPRYEQLVNLLQEMARRLVIFGLHVHVGVDTGDKAIMICDRIMRHLPTLLALSSSSPYWEGRSTGLHSFRSKLMEGLPTAGLPAQMRNWSEYVWLVHHMEETGFIHTIREIWWDVRPHHNFGTVEIRVCDMPGKLSDVLAITALLQCLVKSLSDEIDQGTYQLDCHPMMVRQNKWRACRFGNRAELVDSFTFQIQPVTEVVEQLIARLRPAAETLSCVRYLERCREMAHGPTWAERQLTVAQETGSMPEMVRKFTAASRVGG